MACPVNAISPIPSDAESMTAATRSLEFAKMLASLIKRISQRGQIQVCPAISLKRLLPRMLTGWCGLGAVLSLLVKLHEVGMPVNME